MKRFHPKHSCAATCALVAIISCGCQSTSSGVNNPFMAPDRVAPPSTRYIAPGQAQPYYQGDPLPVMQSATAPSQPNQVTNNSAADARSSSGRTLAWNATASAPPAQVSTQASPTSPWDAGPQAPRPSAYASEAPVAVPNDAGSMRFALPLISAEPAPSLVTSQPSQQAAAFSVAPPPNQDVVLASYNAPQAGQMVPAATQPPLAPMPVAASPWRAPGVPASPMTAPLYGAQPSLQPVQMQAPTNIGSPTVGAYATTPPVPLNSVAAQLRSVPSPAPQPGDPVPRIRIPGYTASQSAGLDGFRPRTSMR